MKSWISDFLTKYMEVFVFTCNFRIVVERVDSKAPRTVAVSWHGTNLPELAHLEHI